MPLAHSPTATGATLVAAGGSGLLLCSLRTELLVHFLTKEELRQENESDLLSFFNHCKLLKGVEK